ncbi:GAF domain-containing protein [Pseudanabaena sp. ABRG5-3]|uniref:GAF domain-containing protein n=1 Tax=Pseudanabaena sp. ABRG5-3 TaxID=685565 RepID=UPI000DC729CA|nr:GAF domain-containing protein [Pseudanabaena sp. ABRG5-3]BBC23810.1 GAF domain protein [Pseudanabaena sp. ABRG5-3]
MDSTLLDQIRHLCRDRAAYERLKAILVQQERVHQLSWEERYKKLMSVPDTETETTNAFSNIIAREKALAQLADAIQRSPSLELVLQVAVQVAQKLLQVDRVAIFRRYPDGRGEFVTDAIASGMVSIADMPERQLLLARHMIDSMQTEQSAQIVDSIRSSSLSSHIVTLLEQIGISSYTANKIYAGHDAWGTLVAFHGTAYHVWSESDRTSLSLVAAQIGIAISLANLRQQSQTLAEDLQTLKVELDSLQKTVAEIIESETQPLITEAPSSLISDIDEPLITMFSQDVTTEEMENNSDDLEDDDQKDLEVEDHIEPISPVEHLVDQDLDEEIGESDEDIEDVEDIVDEDEIIDSEYIAISQNGLPRLFLIQDIKPSSNEDSGEPEDSEDIEPEEETANTDEQATIISHPVDAEELTRDEECLEIVQENTTNSTDTEETQIAESALEFGKVETEEVIVHEIKEINEPEEVIVNEAKEVNEPEETTTKVENISESEAEESQREEIIVNQSEAVDEPEPQSEEETTIVKSEEVSEKESEVLETFKIKSLDAEKIVEPEILDLPSPANVEIETNQQETIAPERLDPITNESRLIAEVSDLEPLALEALVAPKALDVESIKVDDSEEEALATEPCETSSSEDQAKSDANSEIAATSDGLAQPDQEPITSEIESESEDEAGEIVETTTSLSTELEATESLAMETTENIEQESITKNIAENNTEHGNESTSEVEISTLTIGQEKEEIKDVDERLEELAPSDQEKLSQADLETSRPDIYDEERDPAIEPQFMETILAIAGNDSKGINFLLNVIDSYLEETPKLVQAIDKAIAINDHPRLLQILNTLRSSSDYIGALPLSYQCRQLESAVRANYVVLIYACLSQVAIEAQRATEALRIERSRYV